MEITYYFGGYFLLRPKPLEFGADKGKLVQTTSSCINQAIIDTWVYSWTVESKKMLEEVKNDFQIKDEKVKQIQSWVDNNFELNKLQWLDNFSDLDTALEFKNTFFSHLKDIHIYSIYLSAADRENLVSEFEKEPNNHGDFGLRHNLLRKIGEQDNPKETLLGYDLIGVEIDGGYHSFYCNNAKQKLIDKFHLTLNKNGLFNDIDDWTPVKEYLNDEKNGLEPVRWYVAKTKLVTE
jgi:hypothetical protein